MIPQHGVGVLHFRKTLPFALALARLEYLGLERCLAENARYYSPHWHFLGFTTLQHICLTRKRGAIGKK